MLPNEPPPSPAAVQSVFLAEPIESLYLDWTFDQAVTVEAQTAAAAFWTVNDNEPPDTCRGESLEQLSSNVVRVYMGTTVTPGKPAGIDSLPIGLASPGGIAWPFEGTVQEPAGG